MDVLVDLLSAELFAGWTVARVGIGVVAVLGIGWLLKVILGYRRPEGPHIRDAVCSCGWRGRSSRHAPICPRCGKMAVLR